jgi:hypothetical protein
VLHCIQEYQETADEINLDGDKLFINFCCTLRGIAKEDWDSVTALHSYNFPHHVRKLESWKSEMILPTALETLVDYLENIRKPYQMTVEACLDNQLRVMARHVNDIPFPWQDPPTVTQTKIKNIIFRAMPGAWQTNFLHVNAVSTSTILQLQQFMSQEREFTEQSQNSNGHRTESRLTPTSHAHSDAQNNYDDTQDDNAQDNDDVQDESSDIDDITQGGYILPLA